jgi:hypothetical protein
LAVAESEVGASGLLEVVAVAVLEDEEVPKALVAVTVNVYVVASVRFEIVQLVDAVLQVAPLLAVTVYPVITEPPSDTGADQLIPTSRIPDVAAIEPGIPGLPAVVADAEEDAIESPRAFVALTVNV